MDVQSGTYVGTGAVGNQIFLNIVPSFVFIFPLAAQTPSGSHPSLPAAQFITMGSASGVQTTQGITIGAGSFTVDNNSVINFSGTTYHYIAIGADTAVVRTGTYAGDGNNDRNITVASGYQPDVVILGGDAPTGDVGTLVWMANKGGNNTWGWSNTGFSGYSANLIKGVHADGFTVGSGNVVNQVGKTFYYWCFKRATGVLLDGNATPGTGSDNRAIVMSDAFPPDVAIVWKLAAPAGWGGFVRTNAMIGDQTYRATIPTALQPDLVQTLNSDGFTIGATANINLSDIQWWAFRSTPPLASRIFPLRTGLAFAPDRVFPLKTFTSIQADRLFSLVTFLEGVIGAPRDFPLRTWVQVAIDRAFPLRVVGPTALRVLREFPLRTRLGTTLIVDRKFPLKTGPDDIWVKEQKLGDDWTKQAPITDDWTKAAGQTDDWVKQAGGS